MFVLAINNGIFLQWMKYSSGSSTSQDIKRDLTTPLTMEKVFMCCLQLDNTGWNSVCYYCGNTSGNITFRKESLNNATPTALHCLVVCT